jgi:hypothetical protein
LTQIKRLRHRRLPRRHFRFLRERALRRVFATQ